MLNAFFLRAVFDARALLRAIFDVNAHLRAVLAKSYFLRAYDGKSLLRALYDAKPPFFGAVFDDKAFFCARYSMFKALLRAHTY